VAYNSVTNEHLVVWSGDDNTGTLVDNEFEIFGQRFSSVDPLPPRPEHRCRRRRSSACPSGGGAIPRPGVRRRHRRAFAVC
jgi:hypothetical protein